MWMIDLDGGFLGCEITNEAFNWLIRNDQEIVLRRYFREIKQHLYTYYANFYKQKFSFSLKSNAFYINIHLETFNDIVDGICEKLAQHLNGKFQLSESFIISFDVTKPEIDPDFIKAIDAHESRLDDGCDEAMAYLNGDDY